MRIIYNSNVLWVTKDSYSFLSLLCNFWMDCTQFILGGGREPIFFKADGSDVSKPYAIQCILSLNPDLQLSLKFCLTYHAVLASSACFQRLLPRFPFWNTDFKVPVAMEDERERYLTLFLRAHQKEQLRLCRWAPSSPTAACAEDRVSIRQVWCKPLSPLNRLCYSDHLYLVLTMSSLLLRTWRPLKTCHCILTEEEREALVTAFKSWQISQNTLFFTTHAVYNNCIFPPYF